MVRVGSRGVQPSALPNTAPVLSSIPSRPLRRFVQTPRLGPKRLGDRASAPRQRCGPLRTRGQRLGRLRGGGGNPGRSVGSAEVSKRNPLVQAGWASGVQLETGSQAAGCPRSYDGPSAPAAIPICFRCLVSRTGRIPETGQDFIHTGSSSLNRVSSK